jgi:hypothetical protein
LHGIKVLLFIHCLFSLNILGKGTYKWKETGTIYDGDWKKGKRNGFGTYSRPDAKKKGAFVKEYSGGWKNDMRHVRFS